MEVQTCEFCQSKFKTISGLNQHKRIAKKCLKQRGEYNGYTCEDCKGVYATPTILNKHKNSDLCKRKQAVPKKIVVEMFPDEYEQYQNYLKSREPLSIDTIEVLDFNSLLKPFHEKQINELDILLRPLLHRKIIITGDTIKYK